MNFDDARRLGACLSRDYAGDLFRLLVNYRDISASEAASRLNLHIRTAQDFLETLNDLGVLSREEVFERKRPYFRYALASNRVRLDLDLEDLSRARARIERFMGALRRDGTRITENLDFVPVAETDQARN